MQKHTIESVLKNFLTDQAKVLPGAKHQECAEIIETFCMSLNGYAYQNLSPKEAELFDTLFNGSDENQREFTQIFGPDKIVENVSEFLGYFIPKKLAGPAFIESESAGVMESLSLWLLKQGFIDKSISQEMINIIRNQSSLNKEISGIEALLTAHCDANKNLKMGMVVESTFSVSLISNNTIMIRDILEEENYKLKLPDNIIEVCQVGMELALEIGKTGKDWKITKVFGVGF